MTDFLSPQQRQFISTYSKMRNIASQFQNLLAEFDRSFSNHLCYFNPQTFIENNGHIGLAHKIRSLRLTLQEVSDYAESTYTRMGPDHQDADKWLRLSSTFWNDFVKQVMDDLEQQPSSISMASIIPVLPAPSATQAVPNYPAKLKQQHQPKQQQSGMDKRALKSLLLKTQGRFPLYVGSTACRDKDCGSCKQIFENIPLTRCSVVHPRIGPCIEPGWYPHLTSSQWHALKRQHDKVDTFDFTPRPPCSMERENPLRNKPYGKRQSEKAKSVAEVQPEAKAPPLPEEEQASPSPSGSHTPIYQPDESWSEHMERVQPVGIKRKPEDDTSDFVPRRRQIQF